MCCVLRVGVASPAACWIPLVRVATASSMLILDFSGIFTLICLSRIARKASQPVDLLCSDGFCCFVAIRVCMVTMIVVWSEESSRQESISNFCALIPFVMQKSNRSGCQMVILKVYIVADHFWYSCFLGLLASVTDCSWHAL